MKATTIHAPFDIRLRRSTTLDPRPTDAIVRVTAACVCGSDLWPYRGENDMTAGRPHRPRVRRHRRGGRLRGPHRSPGRLRHRAVRVLRQHLPALPGRHADRLRHGGFWGAQDREGLPGRRRPGRVRPGPAGRRHAGLHPRGAGRRPDALAAGALRRHGHRLARRRRRRRAARATPWSSSATAPSACAGCSPRPRWAPSGWSRCRVTPRARRSPAVRRHRHRRRARRGGRGRGPRADRRRRRRRRAGVRRHR